MTHKLFLIGEINEELYEIFTKDLYEIETHFCEGDIVEIELSSGGGTGYDALAFFDRIKNAKLPIHIIATGYVASAAVLVLAAGGRRKMTSSAWVMVHEDSTSRAEDRTTSQMECEARRMRVLEDQWCKLLGETTSTVAEQWAYLHLNETYLTAEQCLSYGLIEEVI